MQYDLIHFEALGKEAKYLEDEMTRALKARLLPAGLKYLVTPQATQEFLAEHPETGLPDLITLKSHSQLPEDYFQGPKKSLVNRGAGYDHVEHLAEKANVASLREYCVNAVAQTAIKFLYTTAGLYNCYASAVATFDRKTVPSYMELDSSRTVTIFGVGKIGKRIYELAEANGLTVQGVDIRAGELARQYGSSVRFVTPGEAMATSDIIINGMNLTRNPQSEMFNVGYFSQELFSKAPRPLIFINVTRGEIAPESVLLELYERGRLTGIACDTFGNEAEFAELVRGNRQSHDKNLNAALKLVELSLSKSANIYVQPHQAFNSDIASKTKAIESVKHIVAWYKNGGRNFDEQLPFY